MTLSPEVERPDRTMQSGSCSGADRAPDSNLLSCLYIPFHSPRYERSETDRSSRLQVHRGKAMSAERREGSDRLKDERYLLGHFHGRANTPRSPARIRFGLD